ncbi:orotidine-5'-phosphate decarboxylase [Pseudorhodoplanes sinuspersici]|uniref:Orotidine 5'-phosphate decarboxylase n=1 Tax=Pseudorhodoplanes sinuspersici TaxID=1235591 RepID=A0A1W6ZP72_9HYPH|nr:orotidine-5'-phosphate decarboxylase [Pseudorhodoplanes sinuspersici]ARP99193.1 orotidine-5'-phosphate decarboxylase [Pseudorhodoplanes sinuspersici]RKE69146.1 orotidine-5'-phosphate decarboxylase [Pseudorhodoplanes sinuspersici]
MTAASKNVSPRERVIVALDLPSVKDAQVLVKQLGDSISFYKIGYQLGYAGGLDFARELIADGKQIFFDLKLHDIGNTVNKGVESIVKTGATFLTVHAYPQTMKAALDASRGSPLKILAVTILTSYNDGDVTDAGYVGNARQQVERKSLQACELGIDGIVCSAEESAMLRPLIGNDRLLVTPGIRPAGADIGDQKRIMTPAAAIKAGSDYLVVGRPITGVADPKASADAIVREVAQATS